MVPGMQHCEGGPGADSFGQITPAGDPRGDLYQALEQWVEKGTAPDKLIATKYLSDDRAKGVKFTRPLCAYPQSVKYKGTGSVDDAASFECVAAGGQVLTAHDAGVTAPRVLYSHEPDFSKSAKSHGIEGTVKLSAIIGIDGQAHDIKVVKSLEPSLDANAVAAVKTWKFAPATKDGHPVAVALNLEIDFKLR